MLVILKILATQRSTTKRFLQTHVRQLSNQRVSRRANQEQLIHAC